MTIDELYFINVRDMSNIVYSVDMLRLKTTITYAEFSEIEFRFDTVWKDYVEKKYMSSQIKNFKYNYVINIENKEQEELGKEGDDEEKISTKNSFWFGFMHNAEKPSWSDKAEYNFTIEFNPNKCGLNGILMYLLNINGEWCLKSLDLAMDLQVSVLDIIYDKGKKRQVTIYSKGFDDRTIYIGKSKNRVKIYNKKKESELLMQGELTRIEISLDMENFPIKNIKLLYVKREVFPELYLNNYIYSLSDYQDKTMFAILYSVQSGLPLNMLSRAYREKIKSMFGSGCLIRFSVDVATSVVRRTLFAYFMKTPNMHFR